MNGRSACLLRFWLVLFSTLPSKCISLVWEPFISNKVLPILFATVYACSVLYTASNVLRASSSRLPITDDLILVIWKSLNLQLPDHCMFWVGYTLGHFGLCGPRNSVPSLASFSPLVHLDVQDITVDSSTDPSCIPVTIKASKTDPSRKGCSIYIGLGKYPLCALHVLLAYLAICGDGPALCFFVKRGNLSRVLYSPTRLGKLWPLQEFLVIFQATAAE